MNPHAPDGLYAPKHYDNLAGDGEHGASDENRLNTACAQALGRPEPHDATITTWGERVVTSALEAELTEAEAPRPDLPSPSTILGALMMLLEIGMWRHKVRRLIQAHDQSVMRERGDC